MENNIEKENNEMLRNQIKEAQHHSSELKSVVTSQTQVEPWVVAKMERATTDLSDITHYLDGQKSMKMAKGGLTPQQEAKVEKVMHEFKQGDLHSGSKQGPIVKDRKQAIAIALAEANAIKKMRTGGGVNSPEIHILNENEKFNKSKYKTIFGDFDNDKLPNLDDPNPTKKGDKSSVEERRITQSIASLLDIKNNLDKTMKSAVKDVAKMSPKDAVIYARTKTPYSIIQKLIAKRLLVPKDPKKGLTDLIGMTIAVDGYDDLMKLRNQIENGNIFDVYEVEDFYKNPLHGYMAVHYVLLFENEGQTYPVELQLKTKRMKMVNEFSHNAYAEHNLDSQV